MARWKSLHDWNLKPIEAIALQRELAPLVRTEPRPLRPFNTVAGADISFNRYSTTVYAAVVVLRIGPVIEMIEEVGVVSETSFPYIPGLLSFREGPALLEAWSRLRSEPDAVLFDGQGIAHPRRLGIASHMGLLLERPTIGCAKSILTGSHGELGLERGTITPLVDKEDTIGAVLRTKTRVRPMYISVGHLINLEQALDLVIKCGAGYRMPEPTRRAHLLVNAMRRGERSFN